jgi:hypothetical protein
VTDNVNSPAHYKIGGIETIDFIEAKKLNYNLGNVVKYITRADHKANRLEDLQKAKWYLEREIGNYPRAAPEPVVEPVKQIAQQLLLPIPKATNQSFKQKYGHNISLTLVKNPRGRLPARDTILFKAWRLIEDLLVHGPAPRKVVTEVLESTFKKANLSKYITIFLDRGLLKVV